MQYKDDDITDKTYMSDTFWLHWLFGQWAKWEQNQSCI